MRVGGTTACRLDSLGVSQHTRGTVCHTLRRVWGLLLPAPPGDDLIASHCAEIEGISHMVDATNPRVVRVERISAQRHPAITFAG